MFKQWIGFRRLKSILICVSFKYRWRRKRLRLRIFFYNLRTKKASHGAQRKTTTDRLTNRRVCTVRRKINIPTGGLEEARASDNSRFVGMPEHAPPSVVLSRSINYQCWSDFCLMGTTLHVYTQHYLLARFSREMFKKDNYIFICTVPNFLPLNSVDKIFITFIRIWEISDFLRRRIRIYKQFRK